MNDDDDSEEVRYANAKRVGLAVAEALRQFRDTMPIGDAISGVVWALAALVASAPETIPVRELARAVGDLLREEVEKDRGKDKPPAVLH